MTTTSRDVCLNRISMEGKYVPVESLLATARVGAELAKS